MKFNSILTIALFVDFVSSEVFSESCAESCRCSNSTDNYHNLNSITYELVNIASDIDFEANQCREDLMLIKEGIGKKDVWTFKLLDASAQPASGFLLGNNFWLGSREQCSYVSRKINIEISDRFKRTMRAGLFDAIAPFEVEMRYIHASHESPLQAQLKIMSENDLHIGLCLPKSCSNAHVKFLAQKLFDAPTNPLSVYEIKPKVLDVKDLKLSTHFWWKRSVWILVFFCIASSILSRKALNLERNIKVDENNNIALGTEREEKLSFWDNFVRCFNSERNKVAIRSQDSPELATNSISGLRSIACFLIAISHICMVTHFKLSNKVSFVDESESFFGLLLLNAALLVDGFFVISGYLAASNLLRDASRVAEIKGNNLLQNAKLYGKMLLHRYVRLTPLLVLSMLMSDVVASLLDDVSVHRQFLRDDLVCSHFWWRNILYIHNLFPYAEQCLTWSWSLACDMQFFIVTTLILMIYIRNPQLGKKLLTISIVAMTIISFVVHIKYKFAITMDVMNHLLGEVYMVPYTRICPYLLGTLTAIYLQANCGSMHVSKQHRSRLWLACWLIFFVIMLGQLLKKAPVVLASLLKVSAHLEVGFVFCWVIIADNSGYRNVFIQFLSRKFFSRYAKTTYAMYLISPTIATLMYGLSSSAGSFNFPEIVIISHVIMKLAGWLSFLATAHFEVPFCNLSRYVLRKQSSKAKTK